MSKETREERLARLRAEGERERRRVEESLERLYEALGVRRGRCCGFGCTCSAAEQDLR